jgi:signal transduction histidine kinase/ActR/RegA family two-component response regulator
MPSPDATDHAVAVAADRSAVSRARVVVAAAAAIGTAVGASTAVWLRFDRSELARSLVAAGLFGAGVFAATIALRLRAQQRWSRAATAIAAARAPGSVGGLAAQAEAARRFLRADGTAIVWTDDPGAPRVAAVAGGTPAGWTAGATVALDVEASAVRPLLGGQRPGALVVWPRQSSRLARWRLGRAMHAGSGAIERARLDDAERRSRLGASHARRHLSMLVSASATLAHAIDDWQPTFQALAAELVPEHADYFAVDVVGDGSTDVVRVAAAHSRGALATVALAPPPGAREELSALLAAGRSALLRDGRDRSAQLAALGLQSLAVIPVPAQGATGTGVTGTGATGVVMSVGTTGPRRGLRPSDVEAYEELAARCGQALERVRLYRQTQDAARAAQLNAARVQALFEASPLAIIEVDPAGGLQSANAAAVALFQWGPPPSPRRPPAEVEAMFAPLREQLVGGHAVVADRVLVHRPDGSGASLSVAAAIVPGGGIVCIFTDVTQREALERELQQKQRMEALGRMAGGVAHDFNNLLTVIVGYSDLLAARMGASDPSYGDVEAIRVAGQQAAAFTEQLLTISKTRQGEPGPVELGRAVRTLEPVLRRLVGDDIALVIDLAPGTPAIAIDEGQLEQVVLNLVVNARDAMPEGGVVAISTGTAPGADGAPMAELIVRDGGVGMDAATLERCFDPFFTTKGRTKGTGLGLATVYGIVDHAGGEITVESEVGAGTTFRAVWPAAAPTSAAPAAAVVPRSAPAGGGGRTVLLVEDEPDVRAYAGRVLSSAGYEVVAAAGGAEALATVADMAAAPALLVTDVLMPGMEGPELAASLAELQPGVPVLFVSGYIEDVRREQLLRGTPSSAFLAKPFTPAALLDAVDRARNAAAAQPSG